MALGLTNLPKNSAAISCSSAAVISIYANLSEGPFGVSMVQKSKNHMFPCVRFYIPPLPFILGLKVPYM